MAAHSVRCSLLLNVAELLERAARDSDLVSCFMDGVDWSYAGSTAHCGADTQAGVVEK